MGKTTDRLTDAQVRFISRQHLFFVATAPSSDDGRVNVSPKGLDTFRVLGPRSVAYLDLTGSGVETIAHVRENGRLTILFCAFEGRPLILRLYGRGRVVTPGDPDWADHAPHFPDLPGARSVILLDVDRVAESCGYAVPLYDYQGERSQLVAYAERKGPDGMKHFRDANNRTSIDGLAGLAPSDQT